MSVLISAFVLGIACGLRAIVGLAAVSWAAESRLLPLQGSWLSFLGARATPYVTSVLAVGEMINDELPKTASRLVTPQIGARVVMGALTGSAIGISHGQLVVGIVAGVAGSVVGTLGGSEARSFVAGLFRRDLPAAFLEDAIAVTLAVVALVELR